jgi:DNA polymerase-1
MGFAFLGGANVEVDADTALLRRMECRACALNRIKSNQHPHMEPTGSDRPLVYMLGEAPSRHEDIGGKQFIGDAGNLLRTRIPRAFRERVRYNNVVRTYPPDRAPKREEIECCRPSIVRDIEATRPKAIFGFGNVPLNWVCGFSGVSMWRGRRMPVRVGSHVCWFYPMFHPALLLKQSRLRRREARDIGSEDERMFAMDLKRAFAELEDLPPAVVHAPADARAGVEVVTSLPRLAELLKEAKTKPACGVDYETTCLRPYDSIARVLSAAVSWGDVSFAFPFDHPGATWTPSERESVTKLWVDYLANAEGAKVSHNLAFEMEWTGVHFGVDLLRCGRWEDTATQAAIVDERRGKHKPGCFSLEFLVQQYFGFNLKKLSGVNRGGLSKVPLRQVLDYNALDAKYHLLLWHEQRRIITDQGLDNAYELGLRRVPTVIQAQIKGVPVDQDTVDRLLLKYTRRITRLEERVKTLNIVKKFERVTGRKFKPYSNPDVLHLFHKMLGRKECEVRDKYTKATRLSCDEAVLATIPHALAKLLVRLRKANKLRSTYVEPLTPNGIGCVLHPDGLLHAQFNTIFAETGRLSCEYPNLQNFPKRSDTSREVRSSIRAPDGCTMLAVDYGQIEARVIAMFTKDKVFCDALWQRYDVHQEWAERIAAAVPSRVDKGDPKAMKKLRTDIKNGWTFPLFFGAKLESAAGYMKIPVEAAQPLYREFWKQFSGVKAWQDQQLKFYNEYGYVECLTGRRRRGPLTVNKVMNSPIQGTAAEIVMDAMCRLYEDGDPELQPEINIHDDLTFVRVPLERAEQIAERVVDTMLKVPFDFVNVPISVELSEGPNWLEMEEVGSYFSDTW